MMRSFTLLRVILLVISQNVVPITVAATSPPSIVSISYQDLASAFGSNENDDQECIASNASTTCTPENDDAGPIPQHLLKAISEAFGPQGLGLVEITDIPPRLVQLRQTVLPLAADLAQLPSIALSELERPNVGYSLGWSHGKEHLRSDPTTGEPIYDTFKGSFYLDPFRDHNVFPTTTLPQLQDPLLEVTQWMTKVALWIAKLCDAYLETNTEASNVLYESLESKLNTKARLLYYFPKEEREMDTNTDDADWCGWHKDHGSLTALLPGMMLEKDPNSSGATAGGGGGGLYIQTRDNTEVPIRIPSTSLAIQVGETVELQSRGLLQATPHAVRSSSRALGRASLAVFLQPEAQQGLPETPPPTADDSLRARHRSTFGAFAEATLQAFQ